MKATSPWDAWEAIKKTLLLFAEEYPNFVISKIEVWDVGGRTYWTKKGKRQDWQREKLKELSEKEKKAGK